MSKKRIERLVEYGHRMNEYEDLINKYNKKLKSKQKLSFSKTQDFIRDVTGNDLDIGVYDNISAHLQKIKPTKNILRKNALETQKIYDNTEEYYAPDMTKIFGGKKTKRKYKYRTIRS